MEAIRLVLGLPGFIAGCVILCAALFGILAWFYHSAGPVGGSVAVLSLALLLYCWLELVYFQGVIRNPILIGLSVPVVFVVGAVVPLNVGLRVGRMTGTAPQPPEKSPAMLEAERVQAEVVQRLLDERRGPSNAQG